jgi:hypothetical protein
MTHERLRAVLTLSVAWVGAAAIIVGAPVGVTAPLGFLLCVLPGMVWLRAMCRHPLPALEGFAAVAAIALGLLVATGFLLNLLPGGLRPASWAISLAALTTVGEAVASARPNVRLIANGRPSRPTAPQALALVLGALGLVAAGTVSIVSAHSSAEERFTELSLVPRSPTRTSTSATLLVTNREEATVRYRLVYATGASTTTHAIELRSGGSYRRVEPVHAGAASATLYRGSSKAPYRHVWLGEPDGRAHSRRSTSR